MNAKDLRQKRAKLIVDARAILERAEKEGRNLTAEEDANYRKAFSDAQELQARAERIEAQDAAERALTESPAPVERPGAQVPGGVPAGDEARSLAFRSFLVNGLAGMTPAERRTLQVDVPGSGGFLIAPPQFSAELIKAADNAVFVMKYASVEDLTEGGSLGQPTLETDASDPTWTSELSIGDEDESLAFGKRELKPHPIAKFIKVSNTLLRRAPRVESIVRDRFAYKFGVAMENGFLNGSGAGQPLGVFTASADGVPTSRDVSTGNTTTAVTFDGLKSAKYGLKPAYLARARWTFHRTVLGTIAKLKDGNGRYIWEDSVKAGEPDRLLGLPVDMSEYAPSTMTTGLYVGMLCDWSAYKVARVMNLEMQRLVELYAASNKTGFIARAEADGQPVLAEAFSRVKLA